MMSIAVLTLAAALVSGAVPQGESYSGQPRIEVEVGDAAGVPVPGAKVLVCPVDAAQPALPRRDLTHPPECAMKWTDAAGLVIFSSLARGAYSVTARLTGFADTSIYPLLIGGEQPMAPDKISIRLVGLAFECGWQ